TQTQPAEASPIATATYSCSGGSGIVASYYDGSSTPATSSDMPPTPGGSVDVVLSDGRVMHLNQTISADGTRYANQDESFVFWSKGNEALVLENGNPSTAYANCIAATSS